MAVLSGQLASLTRGGFDSPQWAIDLYRHAFIEQPYESEAQRWPGGAALTSNLPVTANGRALAGQKLRAHLDDWYHRIHIAPRQLDLGNVVSTQTTAVQVWNAYPEPRTLSAIAGMDEGLQLSGQGAAPLLFMGLQEREWQLSVTPDGSPVLDTTLAWQFDNGDEAALRITANRIIAWAFVPDWGDGVTETLSWATDILQSESGMEQRRAIRLAPRREFGAGMLVEGRERQLLDLQLFGWGSRVWALPIWPDVQLLQVGVPIGATRITCATTGRDFVGGGLALLRSESAFGVEVVEVLSVGPSGLTLKRATQQAWPAGTRLYPARPAQLIEQPSSTRLTDRADRFDARFLIVEACEWPPVMPATLYRGWPVLEERPEESEDQTRTYQRLLLELDSGSAIPMTTDTAGRAFPVMQQRWLLAGRAEQSAYRSLVYALNGRQAALWVPTHAEDLTLAAVVTSVATTLDIEAIGYTRFAMARPGRRDIRIELHDGTVLHRRITGSTELSADVERLAIDSTLGRQVEPADVRRISWLVLCRMDSDSVTIDHETDADGVARSAIMFRGVRDEEFVP